MTEQEQDTLWHERNRFQDLAVALAKLVLVLKPTPEQLLEVSKVQVKEDYETETLTARIQFGPLYGLAHFLPKDNDTECVNWMMHGSLMDALHQFAESDGQRPRVVDDADDATEG